MADEQDLQVIEPAPPDPPQRKLTPRRQAFVNEYLIDNNGTQAAIRAGYAPSGAGVEAANLLKDPSVAAAVAKAQAQRLSRIHMTADTVLQELSLLSNSSIEHYYIDERGNLKPTPEAPEGAMRAIQSVKRTIKLDKDDNMIITVEFKLWDKPGSLKLMGKHANVAACFDRVEVTGRGGGPIDVISRVERLVVDPKAVTSGSDASHSDT